MQAVDFFAVLFVTNASGRDLGANRARDGEGASGRVLARIAASAPREHRVIQRGLRIQRNIAHQHRAPLLIDGKAQLGNLRPRHALLILGNKLGHGVDLHRSIHAPRGDARVEPSADVDGIVARNAAPTFGDVVGERTLEIRGVQEQRPTELASWLRRVARVGQRQRHVCVTEELTVGRAVEGQTIGRNQKTIADLRDAEAVIRKRPAAVEERPTRRGDFVGVTVGRAVHAELRRAVVKAIARPVAESALERLKHRVKGRPALRPTVARQRARRTKRLRLVVRVVGQDPSRRQSDLKSRNRPRNQRPHRRVETRAVMELRRHALCVAGDVTVETVACEFGCVCACVRTRCMRASVRQKRRA